MSSFPLRKYEDHFEYEIHKKISEELGSNFIYFLFDSKWKGHVITKNRFPYPGSKYIIWINPIYEKLYDKNKIQKILGKKIKFKESLEERKSIKFIKHYHF